MRTVLALSIIAHANAASDVGNITKLFEASTRGAVCLGTFLNGLELTLTLLLLGCVTLTLSPLPPSHISHPPHSLQMVHLPLFTMHPVTQISGMSINKEVSLSTSLLS